MQKPSKVVVVVPLYTTQLSQNDRMSLEQTVRVLRSHPFAVICPETLDLAPLANLFKGSDMIEERFSDDHFKSIAGYNKLMLSEELYARFTNFEYMLVCQTDVFVFRDELLQWCAKGYDYIGAPWIASPQNLVTKVLFQITNFFKSDKKKKSTEHFFKVGNGGFSLRKIEKMLRIVREQRTEIDYISAHPNRHRHQIEDVYFSLVAPKKIAMEIPEYKEAAAFCIDRKPQIAMQINNQKLPFACHGFDKSKVKGFWESVLKDHKS